MLAQVLSLVAGILFSIGLVISGMVNPDKVKGFLDIFGTWDYSLAFVMGGAVGLNFVTFKILEARTPICATEHFLPENTSLTKRLIFGSAIFGIGWGILGICPGPGIVNLVTMNSNAFLFVGSMLVGMGIFKTVDLKWGKV